MNSKSTPVTIQDVAREAGVSVSTVSRALNNNYGVSSDTSEKIRQVMKAMNYVPNLAAKGIRSRATNVIGVVLHEVTEQFDLAIIRGVGLAIQNTGYDLLLYAADGRPLNRRATWETEHVAFLSSGLTAGNIIVAPAAPNYPEPTNIVLIDPLGENINIPSVIATNRLGALEVMKYLTDLGHQRIGFIGGRADTQSANDRFEGYRDGLALAGLLYQPEYVQSGDFTREGGRKAAFQLLQQLNRVTAIFAANDETALGVVDVAHELGLAIPDDLSLVGFDNIPDTMMISPSLTTVDQSIQEMGSTATRMLLKILHGEELESVQYKVPTRLVIRESCRPVKN